MTLTLLTSEECCCQASQGCPQLSCACFRIELINYHADYEITSQPPGTFDHVIINASCDIVNGQIVNGFSYASGDNFNGLGYAWSSAGIACDALVCCRTPGSSVCGLNDLQEIACLPESIGAEWIGFIGFRLGHGVPGYICGEDGFLNCCKIFARGGPAFMNQTCPTVGDYQICGPSQAGTFRVSVPQHCGEVQTCWRTLTPCPDSQCLTAYASCGFLDFIGAGIGAVVRAPSGCCYTVGAQVSSRPTPVLDNLIVVQDCASCMPCVDCIHCPDLLVARFPALACTGYANCPVECPETSVPIQRIPGTCKWSVAGVVDGLFFRGIAPTGCNGNNDPVGFSFVVDVECDPATGRFIAKHIRVMIQYPTFGGLGLLPLLAFDCHDCPGPLFSDTGCPKGIYIMGPPHCQSDSCGTPTQMEVA